MFRINEKGCRKTYSGGKTTIEGEINIILVVNGSDVGGMTITEGEAAALARRTLILKRGESFSL